MRTLPRLNVVSKFQAKLFAKRVGSATALLGKVLVFGGVIALATPARAALTIDIQQFGGDVVASETGSLDLSGLGLVTSSGSTSFDYMSPASGIIFVGTPGSSSVYTGFSTIGSLGSGSFTAASSNSGTLTGADKADSYLFLPHNYSSGTQLNGTATWNSTTLNTLGLTAGSSLVYSWSGDSITVNVLTPVPEPAMAILPAFATLFLLVICQRRRTLRSQTASLA
ncbi:MAG TPA: hypothetical protein VIM48_08055 [Chthoniobacterales bacterium]